MAIDIAQISAILQRHGNNLLESQIQNASPNLDHIKRKPGLIGNYALNLNDEGSTAAFGVGNGGVATPAGTSTTPAQALIQPVGFYARLSFPMTTLLMAKGGADAADLIMNNMRAASANGLRALGRALYDYDLCGITTISAGSFTAAATFTATVRDWAAFRIGMFFDLWETSDEFVANGTFHCRAQVTSVSSLVSQGATAGQATVGFTVQAGARGVPSPSGVGPTTVANLRCVLPGFRGSISNAVPATISGFAPIGGDFAGMIRAAGSGNLYNTAFSSIYDYTGNLDVASTGLLTNGLLNAQRSLAGARAQAPTVMFVHPMCYASIETMSQTVSTTDARGQRFFSEGDVIDAYGKNTTMTFHGMPVVSDPNCPLKAVVMIHQDDYQLGEYRRFGVVTDGVVNGGAMALEGQLSIDYQYHGLYNAIVTRRNSTVAIAGGIKSGTGISL